MGNDLDMIGNVALNETEVNGGSMDIHRPFVDCGQFMDSAWLWKWTSRVVGLCVKLPFP